MMTAAANCGGDTSDASGAGNDLGDERVGTIPSCCLERGIPATGSDLFDYGFGYVCDMFDLTGPYENIVSNFPYGDRIKDGRKLLERIEHCLGLVRHQLILILPLTFHESRQRNFFLRKYPYEWFAPCSDRPSMPPSIDGPRDRFGAIIQPDNKEGNAPYGWFGWQPGGPGAMQTRLLDLKSFKARGACRPVSLSSHAGQKCVLLISQEFSLQGPCTFPACMIYSPVWFATAEHLDRKTLEEIWRMAVERVQVGKPPSAVIASYGFCRTTIYKWLRKVKRGGRGDPLRSSQGTGRPPKLTERQKRQVFRWINGKDPRHHGFDFGLWTRHIVARLIADRFGIELSLASVGSCWQA